jgi:hypothetical protein
LGAFEFLPSSPEKDKSMLGLTAAANGSDGDQINGGFGHIE